jgi:hypothetical protein
MKTIVLLLTCATLCGCGVFQDKYKYTKMHELHTKQHITFNQQYQDCGYCNRDKAEQIKSMIADKEIDMSTPVL